MTNKQMISKLKDNAELAQAAYGYYDLIGKKFGEIANNKYKYREFKDITLIDVMNVEYYNYETQDSTFSNTLKLKGDFAPTQAKRFFDKYDLLIHQPNTKSGFSATLFSEKRKQKNTESKGVI